MLMPVFLWSQQTLDLQPKDSIFEAFKGKIELTDVEKLVESYEFDPETNTYVFSKNYEDFIINYPKVLTRKQYEELLLKKNMRDYFRQKIAAADGRLSEEEQKDLLPRFYVNSSLFSSIFGGNTIDIKPTGTVELDLGVRYSKQDNPMISPRNQSSFALDFTPRISLSMQGKVGTNLDVNINYDTEATMGFQQQMIKLNYTPGEDDILQALEVGNVNMPVNNSLMQGAQNLFGVKTHLKFGATTVTGVFSKQNSERKTITAEGGGTVQEFEMFALDYDADRHFFLSQYFRNQYDKSLGKYPYIDTRVRITRVEVWVTNRQNRFSNSNNNFRNIVAIQDLGESKSSQAPLEQTIGLDLQTHPDFFNVQENSPVHNGNNKFDPAAIGKNYLNASIRQTSTTAAGFNISVIEGRDYVRLENARKLTESEFKFHPQLGYISLQQKLSNDEVLAVAYEYTIGDKVYKVGEFATDRTNATEIGFTPEGEQVPSSENLILKMLKSALTSTDEPVWNLMMKNIYQLEGNDLTPEGFRLNILYTDPQPLNYIQPVEGATLPEGVANTALLNVFHLDRLNVTNDIQEGGDGYFDYISSAQSTNPFNDSSNQNNNYSNYDNSGNQQGLQNLNKLEGITVNSENGQIIFTTVEPFGEHLFKKLSNSISENYLQEQTYNQNQKKYVFKDMYRENHARALEDASKNKFQLKGRFRSNASDGIYVGMNIPQGSVVARAGGRPLVEGQDFIVDYQMGRVKIIDPSLQNAQVEISVENNTIFQQQQRTFFGTHIEHAFSEHLQVGATFLRLSEQPLTVKSNYGNESVNNTIYGFNINYNAEAPFLTRWANKLPFVDTDVPSSISFKGEFAYLKPDASNIDRLNGQATSFIDNFEGTQTNIDISEPNSWHLASVPVGFGADKTDISSGFKRAKLSWYKIDPIFYSSSRRPDAITDNDVSSNKTRRISKEEIFPTLDVANGELLTITPLDLTYYPNERGPYNFDPQLAKTNQMTNPQNNWGGIMRSLASTNFVQANVEYVEFWMMDPYTGNNGDTTPLNNSGTLHLNFGYISEDILQDGKKQYENGLPGADGKGATVNSIWGKVPAATSLIYTFDTNPANRTAQDVGLDGLNDEQEAQRFSAFSHLKDPAADNYQYFLNATGSIITRYKNFNGTQGNASTDFTDTNRGSQTTPDVEDVDGDNTMNTINAYYEYKLDIKPNPVIGQNYVVDVRSTNVELSNGSITPVKWVQYKVPLAALPEHAVGAISDLQSVRFMRMFLTGFTEEVTLRMATLDLVQSNWRRYSKKIEDTPNTLIKGINTGFDVRTLNIIDNFSRQPVPYVMPPGIQREQINVNNTIINQNEQSLSLRVYAKDESVASPAGLEPTDARAVFKNVTFDMRQYKKLRMFLHAEALQPSHDARSLKDDQLVAFIRFGNDFDQNFYQVEIPLKITNWNETTAEQIWKIENEIDLNIELLNKIKLSKNADKSFDPSKIYFKNEDELDASLVAKANKLRIGIKGNPNFGMVRSLMLGVRNNTDILYLNSSNKPKDISGEVWFNELRLAELDNKGGWAAVAAMNAKIADLATISAGATLATAGFGSIEQGPQERSREDVFQYNIATAVAAEKLLPKKWNLTIPFSYSVSKESITPKFDPNNPDLELRAALENTNGSEKNEIQNRAIQSTKRTSINFIGVKKNRGENQKQRFYDIENFTFSHSYSNMEHRDFEVEKSSDKQAMSALDYNFSFKPWDLEPFSKISALNSSKYLRWLSDLNINILPTNVTFNSRILRQFNEQKYRMIDVQGIEIQPLYRRNYFFNYNYGLAFQLTRSLNLTYEVANTNMVKNYLDANKRVDNSQDIWDGYFDIGIPNTHQQQFTLNYELPISKLPFLNFVKSTYSYTSDFNWQRASDAFSQLEYQGVSYSLGNTIQNANTHSLNTNFSMDTFYRSIGLVSGRKRKIKPQKEVVLKPGEKIQNQENSNETKAVDASFLNTVIDLVTMVKSVQVNYNQTNATSLPGYLPGLGFWGSTKPSLEFVFGSQADVRYHAAENGWLTTYPEFNQMFTQARTENLQARAELRPLKDLIIDLTANRTYMFNKSEQFDVSADGIYNSRSPYDFGNFSISSFMLATAFSRSDINGSKVFDVFRNNRLQVANRLATQRGIDLSNPENIDEFGFPVGYSRTSQEVLIPSFLSAYSGASLEENPMNFSSKIPLPNWNLTYRGLVRIPWFKQRFTRFSVRHGYRSMYSLNSFQTNFDFTANANTLNTAGNYPSKYLISNINMVEQFNPLISVDFETKSKVQIRAQINKDRMLSLSFDNNLLTEIVGNVFTFGAGFRIKDVAISTDLEGVGKNGKIVSDINVKAEFSWRKENTLIRYLDYDNTLLGSGRNMWNFNLTADYTFSKNFVGAFFYSQDFSRAVISTMYPISNIRAGFTLRYNFGN